MLFSSLKGKKVLLLTHSGADVDAIASAGAIYFSLSKTVFGLGVPDHINKSAKAFAKKIGLKFKINPLLKKFDVLLALDFNSFDLAGSMAEEIKNFKGKIFVIDHHSRGEEPLALKKNTLLDSKAVSTTEIIFKLLKKERVKLKQKAASCIACGIITDSNFFHVADAEVFSIMAESMRASGKNFSQLLSLFSVDVDFSRKIAQLKAAKRVRIFKLGKFVVVLSDVGAFEADSAESLVRVGADVAFVGNLEKDRLQVNGRANNLFLLETKVNLATDVFQRLNDFFEGNGGGHPGAAAFNGKATDLNAVLEKCLKLLQKKLSKRFSGIGLKEYT